MTALVLPYPISANVYWRTRVAGRVAMTYVSPEAKAYKAAVAAIARSAGVQPSAARMRLHVKLFPARPQDWAKRAQKDPDTWADGVRCLDLDNCQKVLIDALNGIAWADDKQLHRIVLERCDPDDQGERTEVVIELLVKQVPVEA